MKSFWQRLFPHPASDARALGALLRGWLPFPLWLCTCLLLRYALPGLLPAGLPQAARFSLSLLLELFAFYGFVFLLLRGEGIPAAEIWRGLLRHLRVDAAKAAALALGLAALNLLWLSGQSLALWNAVNSQYALLGAAAFLAEDWAWIFRFRRRARQGQREE